MSKRIAIFNGFPFHYEMFGFVLEYLTKYNLPFDIFSETRNEMGWIRVYESRFGPLTFKPLREYNRYNYDYVFLLTDDDNKYKYAWVDGAKVIMFEHSGNRSVMRNTHRCIQLRQFVTRIIPSSPETWAFPVWNIGKRIKDPSIIKVVAVGNNCPCNPDELKPWFYDINTPRFVFINRNPAPTQFDHASWSAFPNIRILENIDASHMLEEVATADWLMLLPKNAYQYQIFISAIHPIAYGVGIPLLMKKEWIAAYNLGGIRPFDNTKPLEKPQEDLLREVEQTREQLIERRDKLLEESLSS